MRKAGFCAPVYRTVMFNLMVCRFLSMAGKAAGRIRGWIRPASGRIVRYVQMTYRRRRNVVYYLKLILHLYPLLSRAESHPGRKAETKIPRSIVSEDFCAFIFQDGNKRRINRPGVSCQRRVPGRRQRNDPERLFPREEVKFQSPLQSLFCQVSQAHR